MTIDFWWDNVYLVEVLTNFKMKIAIIERVMVVSKMDNIDFFLSIEGIDS
jgi:hypothetical protein